MLPSYSVHGPDDGWPVVLIHGFPFSRAQWDPQIENLARTYRLIRYDLQGHGSTPSGPGPLSIEFLVDDLVELLDVLGITQATLCGLSMGGYVALRAVDREPGRVHGLVLCDTRAGADSNEGRVKRASAIRAIHANGMGAFAKKMLPALFGKEAALAGGSAVAHIHDIMAATDPEGACQALGAMAARLDLTERLAAIDTPTLVIVGSDDTLTPPTDGRALQALIPGAALVEIENAGHVSNVDEPERFNLAVGTFLDQRLT